jgi:AraC family transcriptional regulator, carnitine catabolism transcriptional activator
VNPKMPRTKPYKIGFLLVPDFSYFGFIAATQPLFLANWRAQRSVFEWSTHSTDGMPVRASNGALVSVDDSIGADHQFRTLLVLASFEPKMHADDTQLRSALRRAASFGVEIGGIETGSELLAAAGLLDGHIAAVHWDNLAGFQERYPKVRARPQVYSAERGRLTCAGGTAVIDMMLGLVEREADSGLSKDVAEQMLVGRPRLATDEQLIVPAAPLEGAADAVQSAVALMEIFIEEPLRAAEIARRVGVSVRRLRRQFQRSMGMTLMRGYIMIRLSKAHNLLQQTDLAVTEIALNAGFHSLEHFSRAYRAAFGCAPSTDRRQTITAPIYRRIARRHRRDEKPHAQRPH